MSVAPIPSPWDRLCHYADHKVNWAICLLRFLHEQLTGEWFGPDHLTAFQVNFDVLAYFDAFRQHMLPSMPSTFHLSFRSGYQITGQFEYSYPDLELVVVSYIMHPPDGQDEYVEVICA